MSTQFGRGILSRYLKVKVLSCTIYFRVLLFKVRNRGAPLQRMKVTCFLLEAAAARRLVTQIIRRPNSYNRIYNLQTALSHTHTLFNNILVLIKQNTIKKFYLPTYILYLQYTNSISTRFDQYVVALKNSTIVL